MIKLTIKIALILITFFFYALSSSAKAEVMNYVLISSDQDISLFEVHGIQADGNVVDLLLDKSPDSYVYYDKDCPLEKAHASVDSYMSQDYFYMDETPSWQWCVVCYSEVWSTQEITTLEGKCLPTPTSKRWLQYYIYTHNEVLDIKSIRVFGLSNMPEDAQIDVYSSTESMVNSNGPDPLLYNQATHRIVRSTAGQSYERQTGAKSADDALLTYTDDSEESIFVALAGETTQCPTIKVQGADRTRYWNSDSTVAGSNWESCCNLDDACSIDSSLPADMWQKRFLIPSLYPGTTKTLAELITVENSPEATLIVSDEAFINKDVATSIANHDNYVSYINEGSHILELSSSAENPMIVIEEEALSDWILELNMPTSTSSTNINLKAFDRIGNELLSDTIVLNGVATKILPSNTYSIQINGAAAPINLLLKVKETNYELQFKHLVTDANDINNKRLLVQHFTKANSKPSLSEEQSVKIVVTSEPTQSLVDTNGSELVQNFSFDTVELSRYLATTNEAYQPNLRFQLVKNQGVIKNNLSTITAKIISSSGFVVKNYQYNSSDFSELDETLFLDLPTSISDDIIAHRAVSIAFHIMIDSDQSTPQLQNAELKVVNAGSTALTTTLMPQSVKSLGIGPNQLNQTLDDSKLSISLFDLPSSFNSREQKQWIDDDFIINDNWAPRPTNIRHFLGYRNWNGYHGAEDFFRSLCPTYPDGRRFDFKGCFSKLNRTINYTTRWKFFPFDSDNMSSKKYLTRNAITNKEFVDNNHNGWGRLSHAFKFNDFKHYANNDFKTLFSQSQFESDKKGFVYADMSDGISETAPQYHGYQTRSILVESVNTYEHPATVSGAFQYPIPGSSDRDVIISAYALNSSLQEQVNELVTKNHPFNATLTLYPTLNANTDFGDTEGFYSSLPQALLGNAPIPQGAIRLRASLDGHVANNLTSGRDYVNSLTSWLHLQQKSNRVPVHGAVSFDVTAMIAAAASNLSGQLLTEMSMTPGYAGYFNFDKDLSAKIEIKSDAGLSDTSNNVIITNNPLALDLSIHSVSIEFGENTTSQSVLVAVYDQDPANLNVTLRHEQAIQLERLNLSSGNRHHFNLKGTANNGVWVSVYSSEDNAFIELEEVSVWNTDSLNIAPYNVAYYDSNITFEEKHTAMLAIGRSMVNEDKILSSARFNTTVNSGWTLNLTRADIETSTADNGQPATLSFDGITLNSNGTLSPQAANQFNHNLSLLQLGLSGDNVSLATYRSLEESLTDPNASAFIGNSLTPAGIVLPAGARLFFTPDRYLAPDLKYTLVVHGWKPSQNTLSLSTSWPNTMAVNEDSLNASTTSGNEWSGVYSYTTSSNADYTDLDIMLENQSADDDYVIITSIEVRVEENTTQMQCYLNDDILKKRKHTRANDNDENTLIAKPFNVFTSAAKRSTPINKPVTTRFDGAVSSGGFPINEYLAYANPLRELSLLDGTSIDSSITLSGWVDNSLNSLDIVDGFNDATYNASLNEQEEKIEIILTHDDTTKLSLFEFQPMMLTFTVKDSDVVSKKITQITIDTDGTKASTISEIPSDLIGEIIIDIKRLTDNGWQSIINTQSTDLSALTIVIEETLNEASIPQLVNGDFSLGHDGQGTMGNYWPYGWENNGVKMYHYNRSWLGVISKDDNNTRLGINAKAKIDQDLGSFKADTQYRLQWRQQFSDLAIKWNNKFIVTITDKSGVILSTKSVKAFKSDNYKDNFTTFKIPSDSSGMINISLELSSESSSDRDLWSLVQFTDFEISLAPKGDEYKQQIDGNDFYIISQWGCETNHALCGNSISFWNRYTTIVPDKEVKWKFTRKEGSDNIFYVISQYGCDWYWSDYRCGEYMSMSNDDGYISGKGNVAWRLEPASEKDTYYIYPHYNCEQETPDARCNDYLSFTGDYIDIHPTDKVAWKLLKASD